MREPQEPNKSGPLSGVRIIDLTTALAGPYATMMLSDLGADVIKVESPRGEITRWVGPFPPLKDGVTRPDVLGGYFMSVNRGKRSIMLDLKTAEGVAELKQLVAGADAVVENYSPGVAARLGIDYDTLSAENPGLVYGSLSGYGAAWAGKSPYESWPAMDVTIQAMAGALSLTGTDDGSPVKIGPGIGDIFPGTLMSLGVVSAIFEARESGKGQKVDIAMFDAILSLCERMVYQYSYQGMVPQPIGNTHPILTPFDVVQVADGWIAIAATTQQRWRAFCEIMGHPELVEDPRFIDEHTRSQHRDEIRDLLEAWTRHRTKAEMAELLGGKVPFGPVNNVKDIFEDPHARARDMLVEVPNPGADVTTIIAGQPLKFSRTVPAPLGRAPYLGEHAEAIRAESSARQR